MVNVLVTGGGTRAPIDDVRYIANVSSGRFSAAITEACLRRGARVWHVHASGAALPFRRSMSLDPDAPEPGAELERLAKLRDAWAEHRARLHLRPLALGTVADYAEALKCALREGPASIAFLAAAVSDYEPEPVAGKIASDAEGVVLRCRRAPKIIRSVRDWVPSVYLVGFKLLSGSSPEGLVRAAEGACVTNRADLTVANDLRLLRAGRHTLHLVRPGHDALTLGPCADLADRLVETVFALAAGRGEPSP